MRCVEQTSTPQQVATAQQPQVAATVAGVSEGTLTLSDGRVLGFAAGGDPSGYPVIGLTTYVPSPTISDSTVSPLWVARAAVRTRLRARHCCTGG